MASETKHNLTFPDADIDEPQKRGSTAKESLFDHVEEQHGTTRDERKLVRKIDLHVLPWLCLTYALSLIDRTNIAAAAVAGMVADLKLVGDQYSIALLIFFITYILTELPSNAVVRRVGTRNYLTFCIACWGIVAMCFGFVKNSGQLFALRVLLGVFEGGFNPTCIYLISSWYTRYEVQQRLAIWFVSGSVISGFTGVISYGLSSLEGAGGLRGWRWIFIVPGAITVALAIPIFFFIADFPENARWISPSELTVVRERLQDDRGETLEEENIKAGFIAAASDWKVYVMSLLLLLPTAGSYSLAFFTPSILSTFGFNVALSQILTTPPYIFSAIVSIGTGILADRVRMRSPFIVGYSALVIVGLVLVGWGNNVGAQLVGLFFAVAGNNCAIPSALAFLSNNVVGTSKRQFSVPIQTIFGGVGGIIGSFMFRQQDYPGYRPGLYATFGCMSLNIALASGLALYFRWQNRLADKHGKVLEGQVGYRYTL